MIKAKMTNGDILFGLSAENVKKLVAGKPIMVNLKDMGLEDRKVFIVYGETEDKIYLDMLDAINLDKTKIHIGGK